MIANVQRFEVQLSWRHGIASSWNRWNCSYMMVWLCATDFVFYEVLHCQWNWMDFDSPNRKESPPAIESRDLMSGRMIVMYTHDCWFRCLQHRYSTLKSVNSNKIRSPTAVGLVPILVPRVVLWRAPVGWVWSGMRPSPLVPLVIVTFCSSFAFERCVSLRARWWFWWSLC